MVELPILDAVDIGETRVVVGSSPTDILNAMAPHGVPTIQCIKRKE